MRRPEKQTQMNTSSASLMNRVDEANNQLTSSESALINKVNEMQTKTASFGYQQNQQQTPKHLIH